MKVFAFYFIRATSLKDCKVHSYDINFVNSISYTKKEFLCVTILIKKVFLEIYSDEWLLIQNE